MISVSTKIKIIVCTIWLLNASCRHNLNNCSILYYFSIFLIIFFSFNNFFNYIFSSNAGYVNAATEEGITRKTPHAFSHFTFVNSNYKKIVVDIQGVQDIYTDPQIHTFNGQDYGEGNLGLRGISLFFLSHR